MIYRKIDHILFPSTIYSIYKPVAKVLWKEYLCF